MARVTAKELVKVYGRDLAVRGVDLDIPDGTFAVFVGPSGCGKTTTLRMIAGLESISHGELKIGDEVVNDIPSRDRKVAMVFQSYALYPHMTVRQNLEFSLKLEKLSKAEIDRRIDAATSVLELEPYLKRKPAALSGGQRQRVAMGRAIVREPSVYLFDEPLSNLDAKLRNQMRVEIKRLQRKLGVTTIYVTHDQIEAMTMADVMVVMKDGLIEQTGTPIDIFERPANLFVAGFIGTPQMNFFEGELLKNNEFQFAASGQKIKLPEARFETLPEVGTKLIAGFRPEDVLPATEDINIKNSSEIKAVIEFEELLGNETLLYAKQGGESFVGRQYSLKKLPLDTEIAFKINLDRIHLFFAETGISLRQ